MHARLQRSLVYLLIPTALLALAIPFLSNPLIFDDDLFFAPGQPERFFSSGAHFFTLRWWVYESLAATVVFVGTEIKWLRLGNLAAHAATALALFFFSRRLLVDLDNKRKLFLSTERASLLVALLFALHPMAVFTQGYLIQRTVICATLFSLLSWLAFWRGLSGSRTSLWMSCALFTIGVFAKEHAVMAPLVSICLFVLFHRSGFKLAFSVREISCAILAQLVIASFVVLQSRGILGTPYEILTPEMLQGETSRSLPPELLYPASALNQAGLYFKYLAMWAFPYSTWMSIDIREPFPVDLASISLWGGALLFLIYGIGSSLLLWRGGTVGLVGLALLAPYVLFATEFSTIRLQEVFVIYRSYLWAPGLFLILALGLRRLQRNMAYLLAFLFVLYGSALSFDRLSTFAHPLLVWDEAARLLERKGSPPGTMGAYRIYFNRGNEYRRAGMLDPALADYGRVIALLPTYAYAFHQRGIIYLDLKQWTRAKTDF